MIDKLKDLLISFAQVQLQSHFMQDMRFIFLIPSVIVVSLIFKSLLCTYLLISHLMTNNYFGKRFIVSLWSQEEY